MVDVHAVSTSGQSHHLPELRIVLIGARELIGDSSNKSAAGNTILGRSVFENNRRTAQSVARQQEVHGRQVTVVDTPGWWWHYPRENTPKLDQIEIKNSVHLCPPGPHAFLLVIPFDLEFLEIYKPSLEEHLQLFHKVFDHTIVLFTVDYQCHVQSLKYKILSSPVLQWILEQCQKRAHVLDVRVRQDSTQVLTLFKKIEAMVAKNAGCHFFIDGAEGNALRDKMEAMVERASKRFAEVQTRRRKLRALIEGGKTPPTHLRIVMVGAQWSGKSSAGNTILRKDAFNVCHGRTTVDCEISHSMVADRQLTVVDSPGWLYNNTLQDLCAMDQLEIENCMHLCPPGPHAVLLVVGLTSAFNASYKKAVQEHMSLFTDEVWKHTIVLFTRGDWLGVKTVEERIESEKGLQWLVEKCGNMYHVLDNTNRRNETQVTELLEKIEEMWAGNKDPHYVDDLELGSAEMMEARKESVHRMAKRITQTSQTQARILKELFSGKTQQIPEMRVVLVGRKESGKSMAGNAILLAELFDTSWIKEGFQDQRRTTMCIKHETNTRMNISVVETPGWFTDAMTPDWLKSEILHSVSMCAPGPHAFLLVVPICKAFTENDYKAAVELLMPFSESVWRQCMVLFTWRDWLRSRSIEEHIAAEGSALKRLVEKCGYRYHALHSGRFCGDSPITLYEKIFDMITRNKGICAVEDTMGQKQPSTLSWQVEWNKREQELIDRMLKAVAQEPEEPTVPSVKMAASMDGAYTPSMSGDFPSDVGSTFWSRRARARVSEWLSTRVGTSDVTSGVGSMSASASYVEKLEDQPIFQEKEIMKLDTVFHGGVSTDTVKNPRRHSF